MRPLRDAIRPLSPSKQSRPQALSEGSSLTLPPQIEADLKSGKLDKLIAMSRRRFRELVDGEVEGVPGPLVLDKLRTKLSLSDEERADLDRALNAYERDRDPGHPAEEVIADIAKRL